MKMIKTLPLLLAVLLVGCKAGVKAPYVGREDPHHSPRVSFSGTYGDQLRRDTATKTENVRRDEHGILHVTLPIRSARDDTLYVEYQVTFLSANNEELSKLGWIPATLEANAPSSVSFNSLDGRAVDFRVVFRYAR